MSMKIGEGISSVMVPSNPMTTLSSFLNHYSQARYIRFEWIDYTGKRRMRLVPVPAAQKLISENKSLFINSAVFFPLQNDLQSAGAHTVGQWALSPTWSGLRILTPTQASLMCAFKGDQGQPGEVPVCPVTVLRKAIEFAKSNYDVEFLVGFETEFVLLDLETYEQLRGVHSWCSAAPLNPKIMACLEEILETLRHAKIEVLYMHAEACPGQFEIITGPLSPLEAVDAVYFTREAVQTVAYNHGFRATLHPLPFPDQIGTAAHIHLSVKKRGNQSSSRIDEQFFAGVLKHLQALMALTMSSPISFDRVRDKCWAGGTWKAWGDHNRETPLRRSDPEDNHWEIRCVDGTANLYLAVAGVTYAGLDGLAQNMKLPPACQMDPAALSDEERAERGIVERLPRKLSDALVALDADNVLLDGIGRPAIQMFMNVRESEGRRFATMGEKEKWRFLVEAY